MPNPPNLKSFSCVQSRDFMLETADILDWSGLIRQILLFFFRPILHTNSLKHHPGQGEIPFPGREKVYGTWWVSVNYNLVFSKFSIYIQSHHVPFTDAFCLYAKGLPWQNGCEEKICAPAHVSIRNNIYPWFSKELLLLGLFILSLLKFPFMEKTFLKTFFSISMFFGTV